MFQYVVRSMVTRSRDSREILKLPKAWNRGIFTDGRLEPAPPTKKPKIRSPRTEREDENGKLGSGRPAREARLTRTWLKRRWFPSPWWEEQMAKSRPQVNKSPGQFLPDQFRALGCLANFIHETDVRRHGTAMSLWVMGRKGYDADRCRIF